MTSKPLLSIAAIIGAVIVVSSSLISLKNALLWKNSEYDRLASIHVGFDYDFVEQQLGKAQVIKPLRAGYEARTFVRREHLVFVIIDPAKQVLVYSVTSCSASFQPTFMTDGPPVTLQQSAMAEKPETSEWELIFTAGSTVSTPEMYWSWSGPSSNGTRHRSWLTGLNPACLSDSQRADFRGPQYVGPAVGAPSEIQEIREQYSANTYAETVQPLTPTFWDLGMIFLPPEGLWDGDCELETCEVIPIAAFEFNLPPGAISERSTREFRP